MSTSTVTVGNIYSKDLYLITPGGNRINFTFTFYLERENKKNETVKIGWSSGTAILDGDFGIANDSSISAMVWYETPGQSGANKNYEINIKNKGQTDWGKNSNRTKILGVEPPEIHTTISATTYSSTIIKIYFKIITKDGTTSYYPENILKPFSYTIGYNLPTYATNNSIYFYRPSHNYIPYGESFILEGIITKGYNNGVQRTEIKKGNLLLEMINGDNIYPSKVVHAVHAPSLNNTQEYTIKSFDNYGDSVEVSKTLTCVEAKEPTIRISNVDSPSATSVEYGTDGARIRMSASYQNGVNFSNAIISLSTQNVTFEDGSTRLEITPNNTTYFTINIGENVNSFNISAIANYIKDSAWSVRSNTFNFTLAKAQPYIESFNSELSYYKETNKRYKMVGTENYMGRIFDLSASIVKKGTNNLLQCYTKIYVIHNKDINNIKKENYSNTTYSQVINTLPNSENNDISSIVKDREYFAFVLYAENDGYIETAMSQIYIKPDIYPSNILTKETQENIVYDNFQISWENYSYSENNRHYLPSNKMRVKISTSQTDGTFIEWKELSIVNTTYEEINNVKQKYNIPNIKELINGNFYGFEIEAIDIEGYNSIVSNIVSVQRNLGPNIKNLILDLQPKYDEYNAYKPLSFLENDYILNLSSSIGNYEAGELTWDLYLLYKDESISSTNKIYSYTALLNEQSGELELNVIKGQESDIGFKKLIPTSTVNYIYSGREIYNYLKSKNNIYNDNDINTNDFKYKIIIKDTFGEENIFDFPINIDYREAPYFDNGALITMGINYNKTLSSSDIFPSIGQNGNRMINLNEKICFTFPKPKDLNGENDIKNYRISIARLDTIPTGDYSELSYSQLGSELIEKEQLIAKENTYLYQYTFPEYNINKFIVFKLEAIDSKGLESNSIYSDTYLVGCRVKPPIFEIIEPKIIDSKLNFKINLIDEGGSRFNNSNYTFDDYNNLNRKIEGINELGEYPVELTINYSTDINFNPNYTKTIKKIFSDIRDITKKWQNDWNNIKIDIDLDSSNGLFLKAELKYPIGFINGSNTNYYYIDDYFGKCYSYTTKYSPETPTVAYRKNHIGINNNIFEANDLLVISQIGEHKIIRINGLKEDEFGNLTPIEIKLDLNTGTLEGLDSISGLTIDGGSW